MWVRVFLRKPVNTFFARRIVRNALRHRRSGGRQGVRLSLLQGSRRIRQVCRGRGRGREIGTFAVIIGFGALFAVAATGVRNTVATTPVLVTTPELIFIVPWSLSG